MRQLTKCGWLLVGGWWMAGSSWLITAPAHAQTADSGKQKATDSKQKAEDTQPPATNAQPSTSADLPILLLVVQRPVGTPAKRDDINSALSLMLRTPVRESRKYQVILYSPDHPSIRRALLEHSIAASELVEPIKPESLQKLARLINVHSILMVNSAMEKTSLRTDVRLMQDAGADSWITPLSQPFTIDAPDRQNAPENRADAGPHCRQH